MVDGCGVKWHWCALLEVALGGLEGCASCRAEVSEKFRVVVADTGKFKQIATAMSDGDRRTTSAVPVWRLIGTEPRQQRVRAASTRPPAPVTLS